jgi:hypothetical protein
MALDRAFPQSQGLLVAVIDVADYKCLPETRSAEFRLVMIRLMVRRLLTS